MTWMNENLHIHQIIAKDGLSATYYYNITYF